jgi:predicted dehydrogenase
MAVTLGFEGGAVGTLTSIWHDVLERPSLRRVELFAERAHVVVEGDWFGPVSWTLSGEEEGAVEGADLLAAVGATDPIADNPDAAFIRAVQRSEPAWPDVHDALRAHVVADAIYRSAAAGGSVVAVPPRPAR